MRKPDDMTKYPPRRQLDKENDLSIEMLEEMAEKAQYCPEKDITVLDDKPVRLRRQTTWFCSSEENEGLKLVKLGIQGGLFDKRKDEAGWPDYIWIVYRSLVYEEAHQGDGIYTVYPLPSTDPFFDEVKNFWRLRNA